MLITKKDLKLASIRIKLFGYTIYIPIKYCSRKHSQVTIIGKNTNFTLLVKGNCTKTIDGVDTLESNRIIDWLTLNKKEINKYWRGNANIPRLIYK
jgi:hypothetical protein